MTVKQGQAWELSPSHEEYYWECKHHVFQVLCEWNAGGYNDWPTDCRFVSLGEPHMTTAWFNQIVELGKRSIKHSVQGFKLQDAMPERTWDEYTHDVYFMEPLHGNVRFGHAKELYAYIVGGGYVRVAHLGCDHPYPQVFQRGNCYREYRCEACGFKWGEDSSG